jgi:hypothetical protein
VVLVVGQHAFGGEHHQDGVVALERREDVRCLDRTRVAPVFGDVGVAVEQRVALHPDAVKPDAAVVDPVQAHLLAVVLDPDAVAQLPVLVAHRDDEHVHTVTLAVDLELCEHRRHPPVPSSVPDVLLAGLESGVSITNWSCSGS